MSRVGPHQKGVWVHHAHQLLYSILQILQVKFQGVTDEKDMSDMQKTLQPIGKLLHEVRNRTDSRTKPVLRKQNGTLQRQSIRG